MQDVLRQEEKERGREARQRLQFKLLTTDQLDDVMAALAFLKTMPGFDSFTGSLRGIPLAGSSPCSRPSATARSVRRLLLLQQQVLGSALPKCATACSLRFAR